MFREEVSKIKPLDNLEQKHLDDALKWIDSGVEVCRIEKPAIPPKHLVSYFVLTDKDYILLVDHKNAGLWLPSGGHVEPGEHPKDTVKREAYEELQIEAEFCIDHPLMITSTETVGSTAGHIDVSLWYVLRGNRKKEMEYDKDEFHAIRWFHYDQIPYQNSDPHMKRFISKLSQTKVLS